MKKRWIGLFGALLLGAVVGCGDSGQSVTVPDTVPPPPKEGPMTNGDPASLTPAAPAAPAAGQTK